jgi:hypothetical protein
MPLYLLSYMFLDGPTTRTLFEALEGAANPSGGWSYQRGKASRLEPTCWALLALDGRSSPQSPTDPAHRMFLERCQRPGGALVEDQRWPINISFNALAAFTWINRRDLAADERSRALLEWLVATKGVQTVQSSSYRQDNSLQGWSWLDATFSWVEPTAWGALALQKGIQAGRVAEAAARARISEAERLLIDRCCRDGGWNFGNANVMGQELFPHVPTTAIALLALQKRREEPAVTRSLAFLETHWRDEPSMLALGLSLICLRTYGRMADAVENQLLSLTRRRAESASSPTVRLPENLHAFAVALTALSLRNDDATFRI